MKTNRDQIGWKGVWETSVPDTLLHAELSGPAKLMWVCLKSYASKTSPNPFPGRHTVCKMLGVGTSSFKKYRRELESKGWLERTGRRHDNGNFGGSVYTMMVSQNCKQSANGGLNYGPPLGGLNYGPPLDGPAGTNPLRSPSSEDHQKEKKTTNTEGAFAQNGGGVAASQPGASPHVNGKEYPALAKAFVTRWALCYEKWFKVSYRPKAKDFQSAEAFFRTFKEAIPRDLLHTACSMWIDTRKKEGISQNERDPLFWSFKGQRDADFFCRNFEKIVAEQAETVENIVGRVTSQEMDQLEEVITAGREDEE